MFSGFNTELQTDLQLRWQQVQQILRQRRMDGLLVSTNANLFYLTGRVYMGFFYLPSTCQPWFFVRRPNTLQGERVVSIRKPEQIPEILREAGLPNPANLLVEGDEISYSEWQRFSVLWESTVCHPDGSQILRRCRMVKTPYETSIMRLTGSRHADVIKSYASLYEPGMSDQEWTVAMINRMLQAGSLGLFRVAGNSMEAFMGTVLAGDNGGAVSPYDFALGGAGLHPSLPVGQSGVKLAPGMAVMVDIAANFFGYLTDCTRTYAIGKLPPDAYHAHDTAIEIQHAIAAAGQPGANCEALYELSLEMAAAVGLSHCYMGLEQKARFVGHGTGIFINELPVLGVRSKDVLQVGMCIALEPKFVLPGVGAVGVEDTYLVTEDGMRSITPSCQEIVTL